MAYEPIKPLRGGGIISRPRVSDVRKPNWDVWRLVPEASLWKAVALSLDIEPRKVRFVPHGWMAGPGARPLFEEGQDFEDRLLVAETNFGENKPLTPGSLIMGSRRASDVSLPQFAAWVKQIGWQAPPELLAMADEEAATNCHSTHSGKRTGAATLKRVTRKKDRLGDLTRFIDDVYTALERNGHALGDNNGRKPLPVSVEDLRTLFLVRHPEHTVALDTFTDDLGQISVAVKPGPKRYELSCLAELLAGKFSG
ncbi:MAG: hypothetical protein ACHBNF_09560 [Chromatiales bacterium]